MSTTPTHAQYIRTEPPALLTEPQTVTLDSHALEALNDYRQARHAWLACSADAIGERARLHKLMENAAVEAAGFVNARVQIALGEPDDWANAES